MAEQPMKEHLASEAGSSNLAPSTSNDPAALNVRDLIDAEEKAASLRFLEYSHFSDLTITCQDTKFKVHKFLLITKGGGFFQRTICGGFSESHTSTIDLPDDEPESVARLLLHIYTRSYWSVSATTQDTRLPQLKDVTPVESESDSEGTPVLMDGSHFDKDRTMTHVKIFAIAAKYGIQSLQHQARKALVHHFVKKIHKTCLDEVQYVGEIVHAVYTSTPSSERDLRDLCLFEILHERDHCPNDCAKSGSRTLLRYFKTRPTLQ